ncbi:MAG: hypothetical protein GY820_34830 [Gammaproteobacteria bacterium]|nr:hypothetical protein [Gammaproteobacteria bacterium]
MKIIKIISASFMVSQLWACAATHNLKPEYDEESKTLVIDAMKITPITYYNEKEQRKDYGFGGKHEYKYFKTGDESCPNISAQSSLADQGVFFIRSSKESILIRYNDSCLTRKIDNIYSLRCLNNVGGKLGMFLTSSTPRGPGYGNLITYQLPTNGCLKKFESYFINKSEPNKIGEFKSNRPGTPEDVFLKSMVE